MTPGTAPGEAPIRLVLFDLGGVLADFRGASALSELLGLPDELVRARWLESPWMRRFDAGKCSADAFAQGVVSEWQLPWTPAEFLDAFPAWLSGPYPGAVELVKRARACARVGCLSNINEIHWRQAQSWSLIAALDPKFVSCELGLVKPQDEIYRHVAASATVTPSQTLFLDDNQINVERAVACGFQAKLARGIAQAEQALIGCSVLPQPEPS